MTGILMTPIPEPRAWIGAEMAKRGGFIDHLDAEERADLARAAALLPDDPDDWIAMRRDSLPLPVLGARLAAMGDQLENGRGFILIRGLDPALSEMEMKRQYWVVGAHLGTVVPQSPRGELMGSVTDKGSRYVEDVHARGYTSNDELVFHSDVGDSVSLLCIRPAQSGGENAIVSMMAIYNIILAEAPELLPTLYRGFPVYIRDDTEGVGFGGNITRQVSKRRYPVFSYHGGILSGGINFKSIRAVPIVSGKPFDAEESAALDFIESVANRPELRLDLRLDPGDILIVDNYMVLHKRERFVDFDDPAQKRLLMRFWINLHRARPLEPSVEAAMRGGYAVEPVMEVG